ncbi:MAG TPA: non-ribosomal peptide synthetase [Pyrinomonadaceae bacterium]|nr:non-ribosomal peptide synthetase [Pyrinomonadaceae bacterium]
MSSTLASTFSILDTPGARAHQRDAKLKALRPTTANADRKPGVMSVPDLIDTCAAISPEAVALSSNGVDVTYRQLNESANQLAHYLISLGVGDETLVGICLNRSLAGVVSALGVLKSGGAYLPIDPAYPTERIAFMLDDAQPRVLITTSAVANQLPSGNWHVITIDDGKLVDEIEEIVKQPKTAPVCEINSEQLAYVIYTSGSTGQPKGVCVTHANLMNLVAWHQEAFNISHEDKASLLAGVGFDAAVWETWPYLTMGASLHLPAESTRLSPEMLRDWIVAQQITVCFLPTALAEPIMPLEWPAETKLRTLLTGAETLRQFPSSRLPFTLVNNYGPTECTVVATSGVIVPETSTSTLPPIGRGISGLQIHILDEQMRPVSANTPGQIYIGGAGVARGYLNRPELSADKFVPNPFGMNPSERLYRTGDLARYLPNGEIAYVGRADEQIKILGHRIEPNEIVAVLDRHAGVKASQVVAREDGCRAKRLVAYVILNSEGTTSAIELRNCVAKELPQHMVPVDFVVLESFPLTPNGKIDRAALPVPNAGNTLRDEVFTGPRTSVEQRIAAMLSTLLGLEKVSVRDNFFMLGGHSLLGTQLISQIRSAFNVELGLRTLFESPTIEQLSLEVERLVIAQIEAMSEEEVNQMLG